MTIDELRALCREGDYALLHVAHLPSRDAATIGLTPSGGPRGEIIRCPTRGGTTGRWLSKSVLRWLDKHEEEATK